MKLDKETIVKHQFWIAFGCFVPLMLITLTWLQWSADAGTQEARDKLKERKGQLTDLNSKTPKRKQDIAKMEERRVGLEKRREKIWEEAWKMQEDLLTWPDADLQEKLSKLKFGDTISDVGLCAAYARPDAYDAQVKQLSNIFKTKVTVGPTTERTFESVRFKGGWKDAIVYVDDWSKKNKAPSSEEVWLAQEDYWVQREVLKALQHGLESLATFHPVEKSPAPAKDEFRQQFENGDWMLDLSMVATKDGKYVMRGRIKNNSNRQQQFGKIHFLVQLYKDGSKPVVLPVEGDPLPAGKDSKIADVVYDLAIRPEGIVGVSQLYEWARTSPIRRIDRIELGAQSHRTFMPRLELAKFSQEKTGDVGAGKTAAGAHTGAGAPPAVPLSLAEQKKKAGPNLTDYGLVRDRYAEVTDQVRRRPLAILMVVDQAQVQTVLTSLENSKFRFQVTQVGMHHFRGKLNAPKEGDKTVKPDAKTPPEDEVKSSLVELAVYCVASLYERFQPGTSKPAAPVAAAAGKTAP